MTKQKAKIMRCIAKLTYVGKMWLSDVELEDGESLNLVLESGSMDALIERLKIAIAEILNYEYNYVGKARISYAIDRTDVIKVISRMPRDVSRGKVK